MGDNLKFLILFVGKSWS